MAIKWSDLKARLRRLLDDSNPATYTWTDPDLLDYVSAALDAFASHTPQRKSETFNLGAGADRFELPSDVIVIGPVQMKADSQTFYLRPYALKPGLDVTDVTFQAGDLGYYQWGDEIVLVAATDVAAVVTLFYFGYWDRVTSDTSMIRVPRWAEEALLWYCVHLALSKPGVQASTLEQYKTRFEAGVQHNPLLEYANYALKRWDAIMSEHSTTDTNGWMAEVG